MRLSRAKINRLSKLIVDALDEVIGALGDTEVVVPRRQTFYGMDEVFVRAPCGTLVGFAARIEGTAD